VEFLEAQPTATAVIARLVRDCALGQAIQYAEASVIEWIGPGILDTPHARGMTASAYFFCP